MKVSPRGFGYTSRKSSFVPIVVDEFRKKILGAIKQDRTRSQSKGIKAGSVTSARGFTADISIPEQAGWTFLINENHPLRDQIIDAIQPLAIHRGMDKPRLPLLYRDQPKELWGNWISKYQTLKKGRFMEPPKYILIIGDPQSVPLGFQSQLNTVAFVGRLDFDDISEITKYSEKVKRIETSDRGFIDRNVTFFATDYGITSSGCFDPTHISRYDVENELIPNVNDFSSRLGLDNNFTTNKILENDATKDSLQNSIKNSNPGIFFASSWGMCAPGENMTLQKEFNGAICCQGDLQNAPYRNILFTGNEVDQSKPFLEGGIFFQQSSFGFGTPTSSEIHNWISPTPDLEMNRNIAPISFVASIPKKLVFHPHGPLAYVGFLDEMLSYTIAPDEDFTLLNRQERVAPISKAIEKILAGLPIGYSLKFMKDQLNVLNYSISDQTGEIVRKLSEGGKIEDSKIKTITDNLLQRHDFKNYLILGDPAVGIKNWL